MRVLIDVDTQVDFMLPSGSLYVPAEPKVLENIREALNSKDYDIVIGSVGSHSYDSWEFQENGGPFPPHCVKGTEGWLRVVNDLPRRTRFVPMLEGTNMLVAAKEGKRYLTPLELCLEAERGVGIYFEKEVYSMFSNPFAGEFVSNLIRAKHLDWPDVTFDVIGYCTGGYCVDQAVEGLHALTEGRAKIRVLSEATAPIGGKEGEKITKAMVERLNCEWV